MKNRQNHDLLNILMMAPRWASVVLGAVIAGSSDDLHAALAVVAVGQQQESPV